MADRQIVLDEEIVPGKRLGRNVWHDDRSKAPEYRAVMATSLVSTRHERRCPAYDQGTLGSCTGNAACGAMMTDPFWEVYRWLTQPDCVSVYSRATEIDPFAGTYPPIDTGSSGLAVAKVLHERGFITWYGHAFGLDECLAALVVAPVIIGIPWYSSFDEPSSTGNISIKAGAYVRGGHEVVLDRINVSKRWVEGTNSWGLTYGVNGRFRMGWGTLGRCLAEQGDAVQFRA